MGMKKIMALIIAAVSGLGFAAYASPASNELKVNYNAANERAATDYKVARARCDSLTGNPKEVCVEEARATQIRARADARALYRNTPKARTEARKAVADADYDVARTKCKSVVGNDRDVCVRQAKANHVAAIADAKADKKVAEARTEANQEKREAEYRVALEKCDAMAGAVKGTCVDSAKLRFGK
jgi:hypothetical protein